MLHSDSIPPIFPNLAFSAGSAIEVNPEISEGYITPKNEKEGTNFFLRRKSQRSTISVHDKSVSASSSSSPPPIKILVGAQERIEQWLRDSGPGSSCLCLWAQAEDMAQSHNAGIKDPSRQLKLAYRMQSEQNLQFLPVLNGTIVEMLPLGAPTHRSPRESLRKYHSLKGTTCANSTMYNPSPTGETLTSTEGGNVNRTVESNSAARAPPMEKRKCVHLIVPEKAYRQLLSMTSPGGLIREFQLLLRRSLLADSNFLDVDFKIVDHPKWLDNHPFAAFFEGRDVFVVIQASKRFSGLKWALLRFEFGAENNGPLIRSTHGDDLCDVQLNCGQKCHNYRESRTLGDGGWWEQSAISGEDKAHTRHMDEDDGGACKLDWKVWTLPLSSEELAGKKDASLGPLTRIVYDALLGAGEGSSSVEETNSLRYVLDSREVAGGEGPYLLRHSTEVIAIETVLPFGHCNGGMTAKEQRAVSLLRSGSLELKGRGLNELLDLLLRPASKHESATGPNIHRRPKGPCIGASSYPNLQSGSCCAIAQPNPSQEGDSGFHQSNDNVKRFNEVVEHVESLSINLKANMSASNPLARGRRERSSALKPLTTAEYFESATEIQNLESKHGTGSQTERPRQAGERRYWSRSEEHTRLPGGIKLREDESAEAKQGVGPASLTNWLRSDFLKAVLEQLMVGSNRNGQWTKEGLDGSKDALNVEVASAACLRVMEIIPREGSSQLATLLVLTLQETYNDVMKLHLNLEQNRNLDSDRQIKSHDNQVKDDPAPLTIAMILEKLSRFCKLLSALISRSPLVGGPFAELGGLDLVLDLYVLLLKRFPVNLRLGALTSVAGASKRVEEQNLPGELVKVLDTPHLNILPCVLPKACLCKVAKTCLMDTCMTPKKEQIDLAWPPKNIEWSALLPFDNLVILDSQSNSNKTSVRDGSFNTPLQVKGSPGRNTDTHRLQEASENEYTKLAPVIDAPDLKLCTFDSSGITNAANNEAQQAFGNGCSLPPIAVEYNVGAIGTSQGSTGSHFSTQTRPFVPRLPLNSLRSSSSSGLAPLLPAGMDTTVEKDMPNPGPKRDKIQPLGGPRSSPKQEFELFAVVCSVKVDLLQTLASLISNRSHSLNVARGRLIQKVQEEECHLLLQFFPDIVGDCLNLVSENTSERCKRMLFEVIFLLDKCKTFGVSRGQSSCCCKVEMVLPSPSEIRPDDFLNSTSSRCLVHGLLHEVGERLTILVCHLAQMLAAFPNSKETAPSIRRETEGRPSIPAATLKNPPFENRVISSGHLLSIWVDIGLLLRVLDGFIQLWPGGGSVQHVLNSCGKQIESVLGLLAECTCKNIWSLAQIVTMERLLKLLTVCMKNSVLEGRPKSCMWNQIDNFFWQLLVMKDLHWNCVKSFTTWVVVKSCQGCLRNLFEGYQTVLWEPLEIYYGMLGERLVYKGAGPDKLACTLDGVGMSKSSIFPFLKVCVLLIKKSLKCQGRCGTQPCPTLYIDRQFFLLDFLMNPVDGLFIKIMKSPTPCIRLNKQIRREATGLNDQLDPTARAIKGMSEFYLASDSRPSKADDFESLFLDQMQEECKRCDLPTPCPSNNAQNSTSCLKQECLIILADIFDLKSLDGVDEPANIAIKPKAQNPFLGCKYVNPFVEIVFFHFLKVYNRNNEIYEPGTTSSSPFRQYALRRFSKSSGRQSSESTLPVNNSTHLETASSQNGLGNDIYCSCNSEDDYVSSMLCVTYCRVLRTLAQNQTNDVSQSFQNIEIMKFLIQQIDLEYEVSQVATPHGSVELPVEMTSPHSIRVPRRLDCRDLGTTVCKSMRLCSSSKPPKAQLPRDKMPKAATFGGSRNVTPSMGMTASALLASKGCPPSARYLLEESSTLSLDQINPPGANEPLLNTFSRQKCQYHDLGFRSARDLNSSIDRGLKLQDLLSDPLFPSGLSFPSADQKPRSFNKEVHSKGVDQTKVKICNRGDLETASPGTSSKRHGGCRSPDENDDSCLGGRNEIRKPPGEYLEELCNPSHAESQGSSLEGRSRRENKAASLPEIRYGGRFFDLNEEVERELAEEDSQDSQPFPQRAERNVHTKRLDMMDGIQEESHLQSNILNLSTVPLDFPQSGVETSDRSLDSEVCSKFGNRISPKQKLTRPAIPRLNLSKSARKGGPTISSDASLELDVVPSNASTLESKSRRNALLKLQKELQRDVFNSDRDRGSNTGIDVSYETERLQRRLYRHVGLHMVLLELFISLMLTSQGALETSYSDRYPMENRKPNAPFFLSYHLNHAANLHLLPSLSKRMKEFKPAAFRILKLSWRALFDPTIYTNRVRIARGAASQVYTARVRQDSRKLGSPEEPEIVVLKTVDVPKGPHDHCKFFDVFSEVEILEKFLGEPAVCQILDYGVDRESFILVLKHYKCSLHNWRIGRGRASGGVAMSPTQEQGMETLRSKFVLDKLPLYLELFNAVLQAVKVLEIKNVVHYDLKCDNILLEPIEPFCSESEFWSPRWPPLDSSKPLPFRVCIADFGQSKASGSLGGECTMRNRGTEYVKSPEMLKLLSNRAQAESDFNLKSTDECVGKAVDVWSLGCLLYELLTGEYLFYNEDWLQFFMRVTLPSEKDVQSLLQAREYSAQELITEKTAAKLDNYGPVVDLLKFILIRDPLRRPTLDNVAICVEQLQMKLAAQAQQAKRSTADDDGPAGVYDFFDEIEDSDMDEYRLNEPAVLTEKRSVQGGDRRRQKLIKCPKFWKQLFCLCQCGRE